MLAGLPSPSYFSLFFSLTPSQQSHSMGLSHNKTLTHSSPTPSGLFGLRLSIMYRTKLPMVLVFNKTDVLSHDFALEWRQDFEVFEVNISRPSSSVLVLLCHFYHDP
jgi:hypothetical protein